MISFIGLFCKRDLQFSGAYWSPSEYVACGTWDAVCVGHVTRMNEAYPHYNTLQRRLPRHTATHCNTLQRRLPRHTAWVTSNMWIRRVHTYEWGVYTHMNETCHTYEWDMSHIWNRHVTHMRRIRISTHSNDAHLRPHIRSLYKVHKASN